jgi:acyl-CoA thioester hydrolase
MTRCFEFRHRVGPEEIDPLGHVNNVAYVDWMQQAAMAHSAALGWPGDRYRRSGAGWVVRSHAIEYLRSAIDGDEILVQTWVATMRKATSLRKYRIVRSGDGELLAEAETLWAFVNFATGQPMRIPREIAAAYPPADNPPPDCGHPPPARSGE